MTSYNICLSLSDLFHLCYLLLSIQQNKKETKYYTSKVIYKNRCESVHFTERHWFRKNVVNPYVNLLDCKITQCKDC